MKTRYGLSSGRPNAAGTVVFKLFGRFPIGTPVRTTFAVLPTIGPEISRSIPGSQVPWAGCVTIGALGGFSGTLQYLLHEENCYLRDPVGVPPLITSRATGNITLTITTGDTTRCSSTNRCSRATPRPFFVVLLLAAGVLRLLVWPLQLLIRNLRKHSKDQHRDETWLFGWSR